MSKSILVYLITSIIDMNYNNFMCDMVRHNLTSTKGDAKHFLSDYRVIYSFLVTCVGIL